MSTVLELNPRLLPEAKREDVPVEAAWQRADFATFEACHFSPPIAEEQIGGLIRQVFLQKGKKRARQVLFSAVDEDANIANLCMMIGNALNRHDSGTTCVVEAVPRSSAKRVHTIQDPIARQPKFGTLRDAAQQLSDRLWFMTTEMLREDGARHWSASWIRGRLAELRLDFDYTVLQGPAAGSHDDACLLASLCDGIVLVLRANSTRRMVAAKIKEKLHSADVRILGAVMTERTFPIPETIYRKL